MRRPLTSLTVAPVFVLMMTGGPARAADPKPAECVAASDAAIKDADNHKLRSERAHLLVCAAPSCPADIRKDCLGRVDEVNTQVPTIIFEAKDGSGADLGAVKVTMDGEVLAERLEGVALQVDPGERSFTFETADRAPVTKKLWIQQGQRDRHEAIAFASAAAGPPSAAAPPLASEVAHPGHGLGTQKILALVAGGVGVVGIGLGTAFGVVAISQKSSAQAACPGTVCANQSDVDKWNGVASSGTISTAGFIIGGVGVAAAAVLWLTAPSPNGTSAQVGLGPGVIQLKGTW